MLIPRLTILYLYITDKCNLKCKHCWIDGDVMKEQFIDYDILEEVVSQMIDMGLLQVNITGGEPLLHPRFIDIIHLFCKSNISIYLNTNGILLDEGICDELGRYQKLIRCSVSLDSSQPNIHDRIRGKKNAFQETVLGIKRLIGVGIPCEIIFTIQEANKHQIKEIYDLACSLNVTLLRYNFLQYGLGDRINKLKNEEGEMSVNEIITLKREIDRLHQDGGLKTSTNLPFSFYKPEEISGLGKRVCGIKHAIGIIPSGHFSLCGVGELNKEMVMGDMRQKSIKEVWSSNTVINKIRRDIPSKLTGVCRRCNLKELCNGYCIAQNYMDSTDITAAFSLCEKMYREGRFPEKYLLKRSVYE